MGQVSANLKSEPIRLLAAKKYVFLECAYTNARMALNPEPSFFGLYMFPFKTDPHIWPGVGLTLNNSGSAAAYNLDTTASLNLFTNEISFEFDMNLITDSGKKYQNSVCGLHLPLENPTQVFEWAVSNRYLVT